MIEVCELPNNTIQVENLVKEYPVIRAVNNISFSIQRGEIFGFLGPNGAGKTTTIRVLLTLISPTSGHIHIFSIDALSNPQGVRQISGYVPQDVSVDGDLTGYENVLMYSKLYNLPAKIRRERIDTVLDYLEIKDRADELVNHYSGGMMRRLEIAQALINRPQVLFLDEPSIGLDPGARRLMWNLIKQLRDEFGATIFINTHDMNEADYLCDRIGIMDKGQLVVLDTPSKLKEKVGGEILTIASRSPGFDTKLTELGYQIMRPLNDHSLDLLVSEGEKLIPPLLETLKLANIEIDSVSLKKPTLDDVFLKFTGTRMDEGETWNQARKSRRNLRKLTG
jgi:ABC-2 type transport system ATP-binding protein